MDMNDPMTHLTSGALVVYLLEWLKSSDRPWLGWVNRHSDGINKLLSAVAAAGITLGISLTGDSAAGWVIHIPPPPVLMAGLWGFLQQFISQQIVYAVTKAAKAKAPMPPPPATHLQKEPEMEKV